MKPATFLVIDTSDARYAPYVMEYLDEKDLLKAKKEYENEPDIQIARLIWESDAKTVHKAPIVYAQPEGECLDKFLEGD